MNPMDLLRIEAEILTLLAHLLITLAISLFLLPRVRTVFFFERCTTILLYHAELEITYHQ